MVSKLWTILNKFFTYSHLLYITTRQVNIFQCIPLKASKTFENPCAFETLNQHNFRKLKLKTHFIIFAITIKLFQISCVFKHKTAQQQTNDAPETIFGLFSWIVLAVTSTYSFLSINKGATLKTYLNGLFIFQKKYGLKEKFKFKYKHLPMEFLSLLLTPAALLTVFIFPPVYVLGMYWFNPCKPSLIGYFIIPECYQKQNYMFSNIFYTTTRVMAKFTVFVGNIYVWYFCVHAFVFIFLAIHVIGTTMLRENISMCWRMYKNNPHIYANAILYRQLQVFNGLSNSVQRNCLGMLIFFAILCFSINLSLLIGMLKHTSRQLNILMTAINIIVTYFAIATILIVIGGMVSVFKESKLKLMNVKKVQFSFKSHFCRGWSRRYWRSCSQLKTQFGANNFLEEGTPIKCLNFALDLTVQFLLLATNK